MMKLTTMGKVVATVSDEGTTPLAEECLQPWEFDPGSIRFVRASANFVCLFRKEGRQHFLRFSDAAERTLAAIEAEVHLVAWLDAQGVPVAAPVPSASGRLVETIDTALGRFHAVVFVGLAGEHREASDCEEGHFRAWGAALGRLHAVMKGYRDATTVSRPSWRDLFKAGAAVSHPSVQAFVSGYAVEHPLRADLLAKLPMFLRLHGMYTYGRLSRALDLPRDSEPPAWLKRLETRLSQVLDAYRASLTTLTTELL